MVPACQLDYYCFVRKNARQVNIVANVERGMYRLLGHRRARSRDISMSLDTACVRTAADSVVK